MHAMRCLRSAVSSSVVAAAPSRSSNSLQQLGGCVTAFSARLLDRSGVHQSPVVQLRGALWLQIQRYSHLSVIALRCGVAPFNGARRSHPMATPPCLTYVVAALHRRASCCSCLCVLVRVCGRAPLGFYVLLWPRSSLMCRISIAAALPPLQQQPSLGCVA